MAHKSVGISSAPLVSHDIIQALMGSLKDVKASERLTHVVHRQSATDDGITFQTLHAKFWLPAWQGINGAATQCEVSV